MSQRLLSWDLFGKGLGMTEADQKKEDDVLRRMLATKPTPHKPLGARKSAKPKARG
jgi:hypothetical protein